MSTKQAIDHLCNALKDKEYRLGWEASIAMAFKDQWDLHGPPDGEVTPKEVHRIANRAAAAFIDQLIGKDMVDAWDAALSELEAQPSEPRLTVDQIMEFVKKWIAEMTPDSPIDPDEWNQPEWIKQESILREHLTKAAQS
jgi:hypothetical protein